MVFVHRLALAILVSVALPACGPWGPLGVIPGGVLAGSAAEVPAAEACGDEVLLAALETRGRWFRHSITLFCFAHDGVLYVPSRNGGTKRWTRNALADPHVRLEIEGKIHVGSLVRVTEMPRGAAHTFLRKVSGVEVEDAQFLLDPPAEGEDRTDLWVFRFEEEAG